MSPFILISFEDYVVKRLAANRNMNGAEFRERLKEAVEAISPGCPKAPVEET